VNGLKRQKEKRTLELHVADHCDLEAEVPLDPRRRPKTKRKIALPDAVVIDAEVDLHLADSGYFLSARLNVSMPGVERDIAQALVNEAEKLVPTARLRVAISTSRSTWSEARRLAVT
jgi:hypothetical protein